MQWLDENFLQSQQEEMMLGHLLREGSNPWIQTVWYLCEALSDSRSTRSSFQSTLETSQLRREMSDIQQLHSVILSPEVSKRAAEFLSSASSPQVSQILRVLSGDVRAIQSIQDKKNSWHAMMSLMLQFNQPALTRRCFLDSRSRGYSYQQKGKTTRGTVLRCESTFVENEREQFAHLKMYLKILAQDEQSVMTTFVRLGLPVDDCTHERSSCTLRAVAETSADLPERINLVEQLGGNDCGHAQRAVLR